MAGDGNQGNRLTPGMEGPTTVSINLLNLRERLSKFSTPDVRKLAVSLSCAFTYHRIVLQRHSAIDPLNVRNLGRLNAEC
jgi:hypothetical protein